MTCPDAKTWDLLSMKLLHEDQAESLRQHLVECERCHAAWQEACRQHTELLEAFQAFDCNHDRRRDQLMALLPQSAPLSKKDIVRWQRPVGEGGIAMTLRRQKTRWMAATAAAAAACMLLMFFLMSAERVVFADVLKNMQQAKTMVCDVATKMTLTKTPPGMSYPGSEEPRRGKMSMYVDGETRALLHEMENNTFVTVGQIGDEGEHPSASSETTKLPQVEPSTMRALYLNDKAYVWAGGKVQVLTSLDAEQQSGPEEWLKLLMKAREAPDRKLGQTLINGRQSVGFEIAGWKLKFGTRPTPGGPTPSDSQSVVRVWVDVEQDLPTQIEIDQQLVSPLMQGTVHSLFENIQWNVPLDPADFQPPSEADLAQAEVVKMPSIDEATFIEFLRAWVDLAKQAQAGMETFKQKADEKGEELPPQITGLIALSDEASLEDSYPEKLDTSWLSGTIVSRLMLVRTAKTLSSQDPLPADIEENERKRLIAERAKEAAQAAARITQNAMLQANAASAFYQRLANEGREPEYFGTTARRGDAAAVLLKWKLDDGRYRVIYSDLRTETVDIAD